MRVSLERMRNVVSGVKERERLVERLKVEMRRAFGPSFDVGRSTQQVFEEAVDRLRDPLFREACPEIPGTYAPLMEHDDQNVRFVVASMLPAKLSEKMHDDRSAEVRHVVAKRASPKVLDEMTSNWPFDDQLFSIISERKLLVENQMHSLVDGPPTLKEREKKWKALSQASKQWEGRELDEEWYRSQAERLIKTYANNIEYCWEEVAVRRLATATKATSGIEIDEKKLYDILKEMIDEREDKRFKALEDEPLREQPLKETLDWLRYGGHRTAGMPVIPVLEMKDDPVQELVDSQCSSSEYVRKFSSLFSVKQSVIPRGVRKYRIGEAKSLMSVPVNATAPSRGPLRFIDEKALDKFCRCWNEVQLHSEGGEPLKIQWNASPLFEGSATFETILR